MRNLTTQKIHAGLYVLDYYTCEMERLLKQGQKNLSDKIQENLGPEVSLESVNPIVTRDFPQYLRYSFTALLVSFTESQLQEFCIEVGRYKSLSEDEVKDALAGLGKIKKSKDFLKKHLADLFSTATRQGFFRAMDKLYDPVFFLGKVRNCILHSSGNIEKLKHKEDQQELRKGVNKYSGFSIVNDYIVLEAEFCNVGKGAVQDLFSNLFTILP